MVQVVKYLVNGDSVSQTGKTAGKKGSTVTWAFTPGCLALGTYLDS